MLYAFRLAGCARSCCGACAASAGVAQVLMQRDVSLNGADDRRGRGRRVREDRQQRLGGGSRPRRPAARFSPGRQGGAAQYRFGTAQGLYGAHVWPHLGRLGFATEPGLELAGQRQLDMSLRLEGRTDQGRRRDHRAVGVSGSTSTGDEACAMAGVAQVAIN